MTLGISRITLFSEWLRCPTKSGRVNFVQIRRAARPHHLRLLQLWLPKGCIVGDQYFALSPARPDGHLGALRIDLATGHWIDHAAGKRGRDVIELLAHLGGFSRTQAAKLLARILGVSDVRD